MNEPSENEETSLTILSAQNGLVESVDEDDEIIEAAGENNLAIVSSSTVKKLAKIGIDATNIGLTSVAKGQLICTMAGLAEIQELTLDVARKSKTIRNRLGAAIAYAALAKSSRDCATAVNANGLATPEKKSDGPKKMFKIVNQVPNSIPTAS